MCAVRVVSECSERSECGEWVFTKVTEGKVVGLWSASGNTG